MTSSLHEWLPLHILFDGLRKVSCGAWQEFRRICSQPLRDRFFPPTPSFGSSSRVALHTSLQNPLAALFESSSCTVKF
jgi:hypothetical protein